MDQREEMNDGSMDAALTALLPKNSERRLMTRLEMSVDHADSTGEEGRKDQQCFNRATRSPRHLLPFVLAANRRQWWWWTSALEVSVEGDDYDDE